MSEDLPVKRRRYPERTKEMIIDALIRNQGFISYAAKDLKMSDAGLSKRIKHGKDKEEFQEALHRIRESLLDDAEKVYHEKIKEGDVKCILHQLDTRGRSRGYGKSNETVTKANLEWKIEIINTTEGEQTIDCTPVEAIEDAEDSTTTEV